MHILIYVIILRAINCSSDSSSPQDTSQQSNELVENVVVEVTTTTTTTTVINEEEKTIKEHEVVGDGQNESSKKEPFSKIEQKDLYINPGVDHHMIIGNCTSETQSKDPLIVVDKNLAGVNKQKKCYIVKTHLDLSPVLDYLKTKNVPIENLFNKYSNGFSFCIEDDTIIKELRKLINNLSIEEDKVYKVSSTQFPISRHLFLIDNYLNYVFNNYFYDNIVFRFLLIDKLFRYLLGTYTYNYTGKGTRLYLLDTTVDSKERVTNISKKTKSCNDHGNFVVDLINNKSKGYAPDAEIVVLDGVNCDGIITLSELLHQLEQIKNEDRPSVLLFGVSGPYSKLLNETIDKISKMGIIVISPAGNNHDNGCYYSPGSAKSSLTVGSLDKYSNISQFSNFGNCVRIYSLGEEITYSNDIKGTSFSSANVASAVLMFLEKYPFAPFTKVWKFINSNSYLNGNTHLVFKIPFLSSGKSSSYSSENNGYGFYEIYIYYIVPFYIILGLIILIYWIYKKIKKKNDGDNEYMLEPNLRHHQTNMAY